MGTEIVTTVVDAFTSFATGVGTGIVDAFNKVFTVTTSEGTVKLSNLAIWGLVFAGVGLATWIVKKLCAKAG